MPKQDLPQNMEEVKNEVDDLETETHEEIHAEQEELNTKQATNSIKTKEDVRRLWMEREQEAGLTPKSKAQEQNNELER